MYFLLALLVVIAITWFLRLGDLREINQLIEQYEAWLDDHSQKPSAYKFQKLYQKAYGTDQAKKEVPVIEGKLLMVHTLDLFKNFPSTTQELYKEQQVELLGIQDVFQERYNEIFSIKYWINFVVFLPKEIINYLGLETDHIVVRALQVIYWLFTPVLVFFRTKLISLVLKLLSDM